MTLRILATLGLLALCAEPTYYAYALTVGGTPPAEGDKPTAVVPPAATAPNPATVPPAEAPPATAPPSYGAPGTLLETPPKVVPKQANGGEEVPPVAAVCTLIDISVPALPTDKPATYDPTIKDSLPGLVEALSACNPHAHVAGVVPGSTKTARINVTQGTDGLAYFKVPSDRTARLLVQFYIVPETWKGDRFWTSGGPLGSRTDVVLKVSDPTLAGRVYQ